MKIELNTNWIDFKNDLECRILSIKDNDIIFKFENEVPCSLSREEFLKIFTKKVLKKYDKTVSSDIYGGNIKVDKSVPKVEKIVSQLDKLLQDSPYTKGELAESLNWSLEKLNMVLSGDEGLDIHQITHIAGALGFDFSIVFKKEVS